MRVMVLVKATSDSECGIMPSAELLSEMNRFNEELVKAGVMLHGGGLRPSSEGMRITFDGSDRSHYPGPFDHIGELVAGYWIWEVKDMPEAVTWARRCPNPMPGSSEIEIRPLYEENDFVTD